MNDHVVDGAILKHTACGDGRMAKVLSKWCSAVVASDIADYGYGDVGRDFLDPMTAHWLATVRDQRVGAIITNPPFDLAIPFIQRALRVTLPAQGKVAILQRHEFDAPIKNHPLFKPPFAMKLVLPRRPRWSDDDKASPRFPYAWYIWDHAWTGEPVIRFLPPVVS